MKQKIEEIFDTSAPETKAEIVDKFKAIVAGREDVRISNSEIDFAFANNHYNISEASFATNIGQNLGGRDVEKNWGLVRYNGNPFAAALGGYTRKPATTGSRVRVKYIGPEDVSGAGNDGRASRRDPDTEMMFSSAFIGTGNTSFDNLDSANEAAPYVWHQNLPIHQIQQSLPNDYLEDSEPDDIMRWLEMFEITAQRRENLAFLRNDDTGTDTYAPTSKLLLGVDGLRGIFSYGLTTTTNAEFSLHNSDTARHELRMYPYSRATGDSNGTGTQATTHSASNMVQAIKRAIKNMPDYCGGDLVMVGHKDVFFMMRNLNGYNVSNPDSVLQEGGTRYNFDNWEPVYSGVNRPAYYFGLKAYAGFDMRSPFGTQVLRNAMTLEGHSGYVFCPNKQFFEWSLYGDNEIKRNTQYIPDRTVFTLTRRPFVTIKNPHAFAIITRHTT